MQIGGKHYVSFNETIKKFSFMDKFDRNLLSLNYDINLRCLFQDSSSTFSEDKNYVGIIFWGKGYYQQMKDQNDIKDIYVIRNWIEKTTRHKEAFNSGTVIIMESDKLIKTSTISSNPHWKLWEYIFGKSYNNFIIENPNTFYLMTGFSWNKNDKQFIFKSGLANSTNQSKNILVENNLGDSPYYTHIKYDLIASGDDNYVFADLDKIKKKEIDSIHKDEDIHLQDFLLDKLSTLFTNNCYPYNIVSYNPPVKWYRITPDHEKLTFISSNVSLIKDKYLIWILEDRLNMYGKMLNCPKPELYKQIQLNKVYAKNILGMQTFPFLVNKYWTSELYHKSSINPDSHIYYFDYHNMLQIDIWFEGKLQNNKVRMSYLVRDPIFKNGNEKLQEHLLEIINLNYTNFYNKYLIYKTKYNLLKNKLDE